MNNNTKSILVLGAGGFIGTNLCRRLICDGNSVVLFDREGVDFSPINQVASDKGVDAPSCIYGEFGDLKESDFADNMLSGIDTVFHLISTTCPTNSNKDIAGEIESNVINTVRLLDACVRNNVRKVVFLSSGGTVYGKNHTGIVAEEEEACPISSYGIQKLSIEKILYLYSEMYDLDYRIVRLSNPYGPYQRPNGIQGVVSTFTWNALCDKTINIYGDGSVIRDYIYIDDAIDGILNIASDKSKHKLYNLGSGIGSSVNDVVEDIKSALKKQVVVAFTEARPVDVPINILNISRYREEFGNPCKVDLVEGITRLALFYNERIHEEN